MSLRILMCTHAPANNRTAVYRSISDRDRDAGLLAFGPLSSDRLETSGSYRRDPTLFRARQNRGGKGVLASLLQPGRYRQDIRFRKAL